MIDPTPEIAELHPTEFPLPEIFEEHEEHIFWIGGTQTLFAAPFYPLTRKVKADEICKPLSATGLSAARRQQFKSIKARLMKRVYPA